MANLTIQTSNTNIIASTNADGNFANPSTITIRASGSYMFYGLYQFDASSLIGKTITSCLFRLYVTKDYGNTGYTLTVYKIRRADWSYNQSTYNIYKTGNNWGSAGAANTSTDIDTSLTATATSLPVGNWVDFDIKSILEDALANNGGVVNIRLNQQSTIDTYQTAASGNDTASLRPKLDIVYSDSGTSKFFQLF